MTAADFDPYYKWLGIPPGEQPPTHYRLLGIVPLEADTDVIANAANRQIAHLRQLLGGDHAPLAGRLLKEVMAAKATLLNPQGKAEYDQTLAPAVDETPPAEEGSAVEEFVIEPTFRRQVKRKPAKRSSLTPFLVRAVPFVMLGIVVAFLLHGGPKISASAPDSPTVAVATSPSTDAGTAAAPAVTESATDPEPSLPQPSAQPPANSKFATDEDAADEMPDGAMPGEAMHDDPAGGQSAQADMAEAESDSTKMPAPSPEAQADAIKQVRATYKLDFGKAKQPAQKIALAKTLLATAREDEEEDAAVQFALFKAVIGLATAAGDFSLALEGWSDLGEHFDVDVPAGQWELLEKSLKTKNVDELKTALLQFSGDSADLDRYDLAHNALEALIAISSPAEAKSLAGRLTALDASADKFDQAKAAMLTLKTNPADPAANLAAGQYLSFVKLDWAKGLPLLSRSDDDTLKSLAKREFTQPDNPGQQVKLGDAWWDYGDGQEDEAIKAGAQSRAGFWYQLALPQLRGPDRERVEARASLEGRVHRQHQSETEVKLSSKLLESKLHGKATFAPATNELTLVYDFTDDAQLQDFDGSGELSDGKLKVAAGELARHVVKFKTLKMSGVVAMKAPAGDVLKSSTGLVAHRDGATIKLSSGSQAVSSSESGPADGAADLPLELQSGERLVVFRLGDAVVGRPMAKNEVGQVQLCGGDEGAAFSQLTISGEVDAAWLSKFFDLPPVAAEKTSPTTKKKPAGKYARVSKIVLWNEHNGPHNNGGTRTCNLILKLAGKNVWQQEDLEVPWAENQATKLAVDVPQVAADEVRVEVTAWHGNDGGLAEVEVLDKAGTNLAKDAVVLASAEHRPGDPRSGATLVDGITDSSAHEVGYWMLPEGQAGWADIRLIPPEAAPSAAKESPLAAKPEPGQPLRKRAGKSVEAKVYACGDDEFQLSINGARVLRGEGNELHSASTQLSAGDVITVKAINGQGKAGFWCVIKFADGQIITSGGAWKAYTPNDPEQWSQPKQVRNVTDVVEGDSGWANEMDDKAKAIFAGVPQIWAPGGDDTCYLAFVMGPIRPKK